MMSLIKDSFQQKKINILLLLITISLFLPFIKLTINEHEKIFIIICRANAKRNAGFRTIKGALWTS